MLEEDIYNETIFQEMSYIDSAILSHFLSCLNKRHKIIFLDMKIDYYMKKNMTYPRYALMCVMC